jgi:serine/threonine protein kinase
MELTRNSDLADSTLKELPKDLPTQLPAELPEEPRTLFEGPREPAESEVTLRYGAPEGGASEGDATVKSSSSAFSAPRISVGSWESFRGWPILEQLPTKGAEADIYVVEAEGTPSVLKLYRHRLEPKLEVLNRVAEISRGYSQHFVVFKDTGFDENTGRWYELQEYVSLGSLKEVARDRKRSPQFVADLFPELAAAIHCLHLNNIIHCDIKPANVLIRSLDPLDAVLTDFGISSLLASDM